MKIKISTEPDPEFLRVIATGEFSLQEAKRTFLEMLEAVATSHITRVLFDGRELTGEPTTMERFYYGIFVAQEVTQLGKDMPRFAYVLREPMLDPRRLGEDVAVNRGAVVKTFSDLNTALSWLLSSKAACTRELS